jgi:hypothetical protein
MRLQIAPYAARSSALFRMSVKTAYGGTDGWACSAEAGQLPSGDLMEEVKQRGGQLGANVLVFDCGAPGTVGQCMCAVTGYVE